MQAAAVPAPLDAACRILHLSDPHFGTENPAVVQALEAFVADVKPTLMILSGDLTQRARQAQFVAARAFISRLQAQCGAPWVAIPGNHDVPLFNLPARLFWPFRGYRAHIMGDLAPEHVDEHLMVLCVNTVRRLRHKDGAVAPEQVEHVVHRLQEAGPAQLRVVVTHQPVHVIDAGERKNLLIGHDLAVRRWAEAGADLVLGGHIHSAYVSRLESKAGGLLSALWAVQAGTAVSRRVRREQPNSVNLICHAPAAVAGGPPAVLIQQWDYRALETLPGQSGDGRFMLVEETALPPQVTSM